MVSPNRIVSGFPHWNRSVRMANSSGWRFQHSLTATSVALGMVLASTMPSCAVEFWNGSASTNWFTVGNWSVIVPDNTTSTRIDTVTPNATVIGAAGAQSTGLRVGVSATGAVSNVYGFIGRYSGATGNVTVDGAGSSWTNSSDLNVGATGSGTLTIRNGGTVSNDYGLVGADPGSIGVATVDGAGSTWTTAGEFYLGQSGNGRPSNCTNTTTARAGRLGRQPCSKILIPPAP